VALTSAQEREIIAIEAGIEIEVLSVSIRRFSVWSNLIDKGLVRVNKRKHPVLTAQGQAEYHRIYMRDYAKKESQS